MKTMLMIVLTVAFSLYAQWSNDPTVNTPICSMPDLQDLPQLVSDGSGGAIITWVDWRNGPADIYAQRISANGFVQWTIDGVSVCSAVGTQNRPMIVADGAGGAIIVWEDLRSGAEDIYAQRINSGGVVQWGANGIPICNAVGSQRLPTLTTDGAGGAIITWYDERAGVIPKVYAQLVNSTGAVQWTTDGLPLCPATTNQRDPKIIADDAGGAIVVWIDNRTNTYTDIYAQRINKLGSILWSTSGLAICTMPFQQSFPSIAPDGNSGAIIAWADQRDSSIFPRPEDIFAQRVDSNGNSLWISDGIPVSVAVGDQRGPKVISDINGAIITWFDTRNGNSNRDIYAQRITLSGTPVWPLNGIAICTAANHQAWANPISDGNGGAIISWEDERSGGINRNIYAQRVDANGTVQWTTNGVAISIASGYKSFSEILSTGTGDGIVVWGDERSGSSNRNIFAQRINKNGSLTSVPFLEHVPTSLSLEQNYPNPFNPSTKISFTLPNEGLVTIKVFDILGNEVAAIVNEFKPAGSYEVEFNTNKLPEGRAGLSSGVYFYKLQADKFTAVKKMVLVR